MQVTKLTASDGRVFYTDQQMNYTDVRVVAERVGGLYQVDILEMPEAEFRATPATIDAATAFGQLQPQGENDV